MLRSMSTPESSLGLPLDQQFDHGEIHAITNRISKVTNARALADVGKFDAALAILHKVRGKYEEERMRKRVDWLIEDIERRKADA
jgi:hypothetical protein